MAVGQAEEVCVGCPETEAEALAQPDGDAAALCDDEAEGHPVALAKALCDRYHLDDITGHDCIAPERKIDPGPAFPMADLRAFCGFGKTLPKVHRA